MEKRMEKERVRKTYRKPSWRKQEVLENFAMQAACKGHPRGTSCCPNAKS
jgi:hypothetical protein